MSGSRRGLPRLRPQAAAERRNLRRLQPQAAAAGGRGLPPWRNLRRLRRAAAGGHCPGRCLARNRAFFLSDTAEIRQFYDTCQARPAGIWDDFVDRTRQHASNDRTRPADCQAVMPWILGHYRSNIATFKSLPAELLSTKGSRKLAN